MKALKIGCGVVCAGLFLLFAIGFFVEKVILEPAEQQESAARLAERSASPTRKWTIERSRSSFDDSPTVELQLEAETRISGWPGRVETPALVLRCREHKTEAYVRTGMTPNVEYDRFNEATVRIRLDHDPATKLIASESTDHEALFLPEPIPLIRSLLKHERLTFGFTPFSSPPAETEFDLRGLTAAIVPLQEACGWK
jgi:type VI secretion system protein VasI